MVRVVLRGFAARKLRAALTAVAIVLGVALMSGTYILTDTINQSFASIFAIGNANKTVIITPSTPLGARVTVSTEPIRASALAKVRSVPGVADAAGTVFVIATLFDSHGKRLNTAAPAFVGSTEASHFESFAAVDGRFPRGPYDLAIDQDAAQRYDLKLGQTMRVAGQSLTRSYRIVGVLKFAGSASFGGASVVLLTLPQAQAIAGEPNSFNEIDVSARPGVSAATLRARIRAVLPSSLAVRTAAAQTKTETSNLESELSFVRTFLLIFAWVALFVGAFIIFNTFSITVAQRTREFGLLRALGATSGQLVRSVVGEGLLLGLGGAALGLGAGIGVAPGLDSLFKAFGADLPDQGTVLQLRTIIVSLLAGTVVTVAAGLLPALRAARVPPMAALREGVRMRDPGVRRSPGARVGLLALRALVVVVLVLAALSIAGFVAGAVVLAVAVLVWIPLTRRRIAAVGGALIGAMTKLVSKLVTWRGLTGRLARENTLRQPGRAAATAAALMIGLGLVTFASILAAGLTDTINQAIDRSFAGNLIVDNSSSAGNVGIPPGIPAALRTIPAVRDVTAVAFTEGKVRGVGSTESVTAIDPSDFASVYRLDWDAGSDAVLTRLGSTGTVLAKAFADSHKFRVGSHLRVLTPSGQRIELVVRGIVTDNAKLLGDLTITLALARGPFAQATDGVDFVSYAAGTRNSAVQPLVNRLLAARFPQTQSQTPAEFKSSEAGSVNSLLALISVLLALSIIVSLFGIVNTLVLSIFERTRELGMLRAIGATRWQIREMICEESIVIALIGGAFGVVLGVVASLIVAATALSGTGFVYAIPVPTLIILFVLAGVAGLIAALWPAGRAGRVNILEALATE